MRVLLVEDDRMVGKAVRQGLTDAGFAVDWVADGQAAELAFATGVHDLAILDLGLPRRDGMVVLRALRAKGNAVPVIITTARDAIAERIAGLNAGADDYVLKPFDFDELVARIRALMRRRAASVSPLYTCGDICLDPVKKTVTLHGAEVNLSPREFAIMEVLMQRPGAVLSREKLEESIYGWDEEIGSNAVEVHLHHLRRKLGNDVIKNVRGVGYKISES